MSTTRCFVAVELPEEVRHGLVDARDAIVTAAPAWRNEKWVAEHNLHLTLKFLGGLEDAQLEGVRRAVDENLARGVGFPMGVAGVRAVPRPRRCSMVWAPLDDPDGACAALAALVDSAAVASGLPADEERRFKPHVTLVRARKPHSLSHEALTCADAALARRSLSMSVLSVTLFASTLTRTGPVYEAIDSWPLSDWR